MWQLLSAATDAGISAASVRWVAVRPGVGVGLGEVGVGLGEVGAGDGGGVGVALPNGGRCVAPARMKYSTSRAAAPPASSTFWFGPPGAPAGGPVARAVRVGRRRLRRCGPGPRRNPACGGTAPACG